MKLNTLLHSTACGHKELAVWGREPLNVVIGVIASIYRVLRSPQEKGRPFACGELSEESFPEPVCVMRKPEIS